MLAFSDEMDAAEARQWYRKHHSAWWIEIFFTEPDPLNNAFLSHGAQKVPHRLKTVSKLPRLIKLVFPYLLRDILTDVEV